VKAVGIEQRENVRIYCGSESKRGGKKMKIFLLTAKNFLKLCHQDYLASPIGQM
jgi:hypothetical protein